ncbi:hypothetical protein CJ179_35445 [Rhodococcus sp. ACS1]|nr:hypothetical protein CJ179_35445 [Rhodococcus sp. ACS1]
MLSAPATIPPIRDPILRPGLLPLSVGTLRCRSASVSRPLACANAITGTSPAVATKLESSNLDAETGLV